MGALGTVLCGWLVFVKYVRHEGIADRPLLLAAIVLLVMGVQFLMSGLIAEMQARTYHESQDKPIYVIREVREATARAREVMGA